jgi:phosphoribosylaminoimidazole-succinocarboxamide synthase
LVATDRLSAYDHVLRPGIPHKGKILTQLSSFWFERLERIVPHHLLATDAADFPRELAPHRELLSGRAVLTRKAQVVPFECVARGYLAGSAYRGRTLARPGGSFRASSAKTGQCCNCRTAVTSTTSASTSSFAAARV